MIRMDRAMYKYILKRLMAMIPIIIGVTLIVFAILEFSPGNPGRIILGPQATEEAVEQLNEELGYNKPFVVKYVTYIKNALSGDFGISYKTKSPVLEEISTRFPVTLKLTFFTVLIAILFSIPAGVLSAVKQYSIVDMISLGIAMLLASIPDFWLGLLLMLGFSLKLGILPAMGASSLAHFVLPSFTLSAACTALFLRMTRATMLEVIRQDYITTAKAKGANKNRIIWKHALRNSLIPVVTTIGMDIAWLFAGTVLVETVFGMPGVGSLLVKSIRAKDVPVVMGTVILMSIVASFMNLIVDISYAYIDPRIKAQYKS